jgi:hypothetical protein
MTKTKHTPIPWKVQAEFLTIYATSDPARGTGITIAIAQILVDQLDGGSQEAEANAAFIVRACNSFDDLLAACENAARNAETELYMFPVDADVTVRKFRETQANIYRAAIALARGEAVTQ